MSDTPQYEREEPALALYLLAVDPAGLGGIALRGLPGPGRDAALAMLKALLNDKPMMHVPINVSDDRLLGGLDIAATLQSGRPLVQRGLLERADGGLVVLAMAERLAERTVAVLCQALDTKRVVVERDGLSLVRESSFGVVALDESVTEDEHLAGSLSDRLAFALWTDQVSAADLASIDFDDDDIEHARTQLSSVTVSDEVLQAITRTALAVGVWSLRPAIMAVTAARALAALEGEPAVSMEHAAKAARLTLSHRALNINMPESDEAPPPPPEPEQEPPSDDEMKDDQPSQSAGELADTVVEAAQAVLPEQLLRALASGLPQKSRTVGRGAASRAPAQKRGRPIGVRSVTRLGDEKLNILATAKAAAPWQRIRGAERGRLKVYPDDFRITRYQTKTQNTTIFAVDASGSSAAQRLGEVKGAVELLLAECYVTRAQVAVVAFRKTHAEILLPPTRSLTRAKRELANLPGGGATPLANAIDLTRELCDRVRRAGQQPSIVFLTDGRGNVGRDGTLGDPDATEQALTAARELRELNIGCVLVDTSRRPRERARKMAEAMGAHYLPLPYADAGALASAVVQAA